MPIKDGKKLRSKSVIIFLAALFVLLFATLSYFLFDYFDFNEVVFKHKNENQGANSLPNAGKDPDVQYQYFIDIDKEIPDFVVSRSVEIPEALGYSVNYYKSVGIRVISTGNISNTELYDDRGNKLADVVQVEVYIDDKENFINENKNLNVALNIYTEEPDILNVSPVDIFSMAMSAKALELINDVPRGGVVDEQLYEREMRLYAEELNKVFYTKDFLKQLFSEGTVWVISPFLNTEDFYKEHVFDDMYIDILKQYYGRGGSNIMESVLSGDITSIKEPILVTDMYVFENGGK